MSKRFLAVVLILALQGMPYVVDASDEVESCIKLDRIDVADDVILNASDRHTLLNPYLGRCINGQLLKAIMTDVSGFYMKHGHVTTRAYLKRQNITDGQIEISVMKGSIENIVDANTKESNTKIITAFAFQKGYVLNLRDLETALEMMNRPPSSDASFEIKPGSQPGASIVEIKDKTSSPYHFSIGLNGQKDLNDKNLSLTGEISIDNPLKINDILTFRYNGSRVQKVYQSNNGLELNYSFPIASYLVEIVGTDFSYRQGVNGVNDTYLSSGVTQGLRLRLSKVLWRNQKNKFSTALSIFHKNSKNYFSNQIIEVSSYRTTLTQVDLSHTHLQDWGQLTSTYSYYQGTDWFGARDDNYISAETGSVNQAKLQFIKHSLDANLLYHFKDKSYQFTSNAHVQFSTDLLYDNDKLTVGSDYTVRGYSSPNLYGNNAWYIKNDVIKTWQINLEPSTLQDVSISVGLDYGEVRCESDNQSSCGSVTGTAVGFSTKGKHLSTSFVWSKPLRQLSTNFKMDDLFKFDIIWEF